jgi:hypothetical protein
VERLEDKKGLETILRPPNNLIQGSVGNKENGYPVWDSNKTKINDAKEHNDAQKNTIKEEILHLTTENFMEILLDVVK